MTLRYILLGILQNLKEAHYRVVGVSSPGPHVPAIEGAGIRHIPVRMSRSLTPFSDLVSLVRLYHVLRRESFTIVHTHTPKGSLIGQLAARLAGVPIVVNTVHGFYFHERMHRAPRRLLILLERFLARYSDLIFSVNEEDIATAARERICPAGKIVHLEEGIDVDRFDRNRYADKEIELRRNELGLAPGAPVVGFVGRLVREKGVLDLLRAARIVAESVPAVRFLFVGPVDEEKTDAITPATAKDYGIDELCIFTGLRDDTPWLYAMMDVFALPSYREGLPLSPMEAMAMEVPCVVTDVRGCREVVTDGINGLIVPPGDAEALAEAITTLIEEREKANQMGVRGRQIALARFDQRRIAARIAQEYAQLLQAKGFNTPARSVSAG